MPSFGPDQIEAMDKRRTRRNFLGTTIAGGAAAAIVAAFELKSSKKKIVAQSTIQTPTPSTETGLQRVVAHSQPENASAAEALTPTMFIPGETKMSMAAGPDDLKFRQGITLQSPAFPYKSSINSINGADVYGSAWISIFNAEVVKADGKVYIKIPKVDTVIGRNSDGTPHYDTQRNLFVEINNDTLESGQLKPAGMPIPIDKQNGITVPPKNGHAFSEIKALQ
ncbi:MAG TPA: hypothetical protein VG965_04080 [Patescibacteria group bacterium]|nr:hypothetical protein [Patescibacteria group bacterium]